jgi:hypothetical protein
VYSGGARKKVWCTLITNNAAESSGGNAMFKLCVFLKGSDSPTPDKIMHNLTLTELFKILVQMAKEGDHQFVIYPREGKPVTVS